MNVKLSELFFSCTKIGAMLLGGGYVIVPLLTNEFVEKKKWLTKEEVIDFYALAQCVPGIIAGNTMFFTGYKLRGKTGALVAYFGLILPPFIVVLSVISIINILVNSIIMKNIFWGVNAAIVILIFLAVKEVWKSSVVDKFTFIIFVLMFTLCALNVSPTLIIIFSALLGLLNYKIKRAGAK